MRSPWQQKACADNANATAVYVVSRRTVDGLGPEKLLQDIVFLVVTGDAKSFVAKYRDLLQFEWAGFSTWIHTIAKDDEAILRDSAVAFVLAIAKAVGSSIGDQVIGDIDFDTGSVKFAVSNVDYTYAVSAAGKSDFPFDVINKAVSAFGGKSRLRSPTGEYSVAHFCPTIVVNLPTADIEKLKKQVNVHIPRVVTEGEFETDRQAVEADSREYLMRLKARTEEQVTHAVADWVNGRVKASIGKYIDKAPRELQKAYATLDQILEMQLGYQGGVTDLLFNSPRGITANEQDEKAVIAYEIQKRLRDALLDRLRKSLDSEVANEQQKKVKLLKELHKSNYSVNKEVLNLLNTPDISGVLGPLFSKVGGKIALGDVRVDLRTGNFIFDATIRCHHKWKLSDAHLPKEAVRIFDSLFGVAL